MTLANNGCRANGALLFLHCAPANRSPSAGQGSMALVPEINPLCAFYQSHRYVRREPNPNKPKYVPLGDCQAVDTYRVCGSIRVGAGQAGQALTPPPTQSSPPNRYPLSLVGALKNRVLVPKKNWSRARGQKRRCGFAIGRAFNRRLSQALLRRRFAEVACWASCAVLLGVAI